MFDVSTRSLAIASLAVSTVAVIAALGGAAVSATGSNFILGRANSANTQTTLISDGNNKTLLLSNLSTAGNATALGLTVKPGHPPMVVNSPVKVAQLNADKLDNFDSAEFGQIFAFKNKIFLTKTLTAGANFALAAPFTPTFSGRCEVIVDAQFSFGAVGTTVRGPYFRAAVKRGAAAPADDKVHGHYFPPVWGDNSANHSVPLTRAAAFDVVAGEPTQFGAYFNNGSGVWIGKTADITLNYFCTTIGSYAGPA
jgi:hypothetical protein